MKAELDVVRDSLASQIGSLFVEDDCSKQFLVYSFNSTFFAGLEELFKIEPGEFLASLILFVEDTCALTNNQNKLFPRIF